MFGAAASCCVKAVLESTEREQASAEMEQTLRYATLAVVPAAIPLLRCGVYCGLSSSMAHQLERFPLVSLLCAAGVLTYWLLQAVWLPPSVRIGYELPSGLAVRVRSGATVSALTGTTTAYRVNGASDVRGSSRQQPQNYQSAASICQLVAR